MHDDITRTQRLEARRAARQRRRRTEIITAAVVVGVALAAVGVTLAVNSRRLSASSTASGATPAVETTAAAEVTRTEAPTEPPPPAAEPATITVAAVGDMQFDRRVADLISASGGKAPLAKVAEHLSAADITVGNLESTLSDHGTRSTIKDYTFKGKPAGVEGLALAGFDFVSLANNHALDCGGEAMLDTVARLNDNGIAPTGAGADKAAAWAPAVRDIDGTTVAYLAFSHILPNGFVATDSRPGIARGRQKMDEVEAAIRDANEKYDYVLVSFHWGVEYADYCNGDQVADAHRAIDAGADMVLAHHPHVIQAVETYKGKLIAYSLGDFVFDHYSRKTGEAFVLDAELGPNGIGTVKITPVYLDTYGQPDYVSGEDASAILSRLKTISAERSTTVAISGATATVAMR